jgi:hypothetical protein
MLRLTIEDRLHVRNRLRRHVRKYAAVWAFEAERLAVRVIYRPVALYDYAHRVPAIMVFEAHCPFLFTVSTGR